MGITAPRRWEATSTLSSAELSTSSTRPSDGNRTTFRRGQTCRQLCVGTGSWILRIFRHPNKTLSVEQNHINHGLHSRLHWSSRRVQFNGYAES
eukprot:7122959-Heterocapsa_arctica.AAC.1